MTLIVSFHPGSLGAVDAGWLLAGSDDCFIRLYQNIIESSRVQMNLCNSSRSSTYWGAHSGHEAQLPPINTGLFQPPSNALMRTASESLLERQAALLAKGRQFASLYIKVCLLLWVHFIRG